MTRPSTGLLLVGVFVLLSLAAVVGGFLVIGSPADQRALALDRQRVAHLQRIATAIDHFWAEHKRLPAGLAELSEDWPRQTEDPETGAPYRYEATSPGSYKLCADFARAHKAPADSPWNGQFASHGAGLHCFTVKAGIDRMPFGTQPMLLQ